MVNEISVVQIHDRFEQLASQGPTGLLVKWTRTQPREKSVKVSQWEIFHDQATLRFPFDVFDESDNVRLLLLVSDYHA